MKIIRINVLVILAKIMIRESRKKVSRRLACDLDDMLAVMERRTTRYRSRLMAVRNHIADRPATKDTNPYISHPAGRETMFAGSWQPDNCYDGHKLLLVYYSVYGR